MWLPESAGHADSRPPTLATPSRELLLTNPFHGFTFSTFQPPGRLSISRFVNYLREDNFTLCPSSSQRIISNRHHFSFHRCLHHSYRHFSSGLIIPYWLVTFVHVHAAWTSTRTLFISINQSSLEIVRHTLTIGSSLLKLLDSLRHHLPYLA